MFILCGNTSSFLVLLEAVFLVGLCGLGAAGRGVVCFSAAVAVEHGRLTCQPYASILQKDYRTDI